MRRLGAVLSCRVWASGKAIMSSILRMSAPEPLSESRKEVKVRIKARCSGDKGPVRAPVVSAIFVLLGLER